MTDVAMAPTLDDVMNRLYDRAGQDAWWAAYWAADEDERYRMALLVKIAAGV